MLGVRKGDPTDELALAFLGIGMVSQSAVPLRACGMVLFPEAVPGWPDAPGNARYWPGFAVWYRGGGVVVVGAVDGDDTMLPVELASPLFLEGEATGVTCCEPDDALCGGGGGAGG